MKKLFVLMMCAMLAVPSVGMNVQATATVSGGNLGGEGIAISKMTLDEAAKETANELNDYYI